MVMRIASFDAAEFIETEEDEAFLLADAFDTGDLAHIRHVIKTIARARGMTKIASEAGVSRETLYRSLGPNGDPQMSTLFGLLRALDVRVSVVPHDHALSTEQSFAIDVKDGLKTIEDMPALDAGPPSIDLEPANDGASVKVSKHQQLTKTDVKRHEPTPQRSSISEKANRSKKPKGLKETA